jgi:hypothetical protein
LKSPKNWSPKVPGLGSVMNSATLPTIHTAWTTVWSSALCGVSHCHKCWHQGRDTLASFFVQLFSVCPSVLQQHWLYHIWARRWGSQKIFGCKSDNCLHGVYVDFFTKSFNKLVLQWDKCLNTGGDYVEK